MGDDIAEGVIGVCGNDVSFVILVGDDVTVAVVNGEIVAIAVLLQQQTADAARVLQCPAQIFAPNVGLVSRTVHIFGDDVPPLVDVAPSGRLYPIVSGLEVTLCCDAPPHEVVDENLLFDFVRDGDELILGIVFIVELPIGEQIPVSVVFEFHAVDFGILVQVISGVGFDNAVIRRTSPVADQIVGIAVAGNRKHEWPKVMFSNQTDETQFCFLFQIPQRSLTPTNSFLLSLAKHLLIDI